jgi:hypothetical protein
MNHPAIRFQSNESYQKWKLIYRASRDGFSAQNFHDCCDGKSNTLTIIQSANYKVFGGFTGAAWSQSDGFKEDNYAFVFSLLNDINETKVFRCNESLNAIYCNQNYGPCFGNDDIKISNNCNANTASESILGLTYGESDVEYGSDESKTILAGSRYFQVAEIEVFSKDFTPLNHVFY